MTFVSKKVSESGADISGRHHCLIYLVIFVDTVQVTEKQMQIFLKIVVVFTL